VPTVAIDVREATVLPLRGWNRYVVELVRGLQDGAAPDLTVRPLAGSGPGPELLWEQVGLPRALRRTGAALVHAPNCFLPLRRPCPGVVTIHDLAFEVYPDDFSARTGWKYRTFTRRGARSAERIITDSDHTADDVAERYGVDRGKIRVVPLAPALPDTGASPPRGPYLLAVGDLRAKKDPRTLVRAWRALREEGLPHRLVLAGADGGEAAALRAAAGGEPLEITGYIDDAALDGLIRGADLLVHPSLYEGFGLVLVEAMARGTPVVAARATALPGTAAGAAMLFEPGDHEDLAAAIHGVLDDADLRESLVARGHARAAELSWAATAAKTADVYRELLA
jgi:glycosyltransferase involved in cell wall biosynthesis